MTLHPPWESIHHQGALLSMTVRMRWKYRLPLLIVIKELATKVLTVAALVIVTIAVLIKSILIDRYEVGRFQNLEKEKAGHDLHGSCKEAGQLLPPFSNSLL
mmetsp:Transcript_62198/g.124675  ORF Transcript_62198/g.124675 Transcript_62198/m.124675 type:complete len:102 (+) Transcript_62198:738-1043(+)